MALNVKDFGAVGDGIVDDTVAIQTCISAAFLDPIEKVAYIPEGTYKVASRLLIHKEVTLLGPGVTRGSQWDTINNVWSHEATATLLLSINSGIDMTSGSKVKGVALVYPDVNMMANQPHGGGTCFDLFIHSDEPEDAVVVRPEIENVSCPNSGTFIFWNLKVINGKIKDVFGASTSRFIQLGIENDNIDISDAVADPNLAFLHGLPSVDNIFRNADILSSGFGNYFIYAPGGKSLTINKSRTLGYSHGLSAQSVDGLSVSQCSLNVFFFAIRFDGAMKNAYVDKTSLRSDKSIAIVLSGWKNPKMNNIRFSELTIEKSVEHALKGQEVNGLSFTNSLVKGIEHAQYGPTGPKGVFDLTSSSSFNLINNRIEVVGEQVIMAILNSISGFNIRDNFYGGQGGGGISPVSVSGSSAGRIESNTQDSTGGAIPASWISASTDVVAENFRTAIV